MKRPLNAPSPLRHAPIRRRAALAAAILAPMLAAPAQAAVVFDVSFDASTSMLTTTEKTNITTHLQEAGRRWASLLAIDGARSIEIQVSIAGIATSDGASATSQAIGTVDGRTLYEQGVAYELETGVDPNGAQPDAIIRFGLDYLRNQLWFDPAPTQRTAPIPANRIDALSVCLHELGHAIVYSGWSDLVTGVSPAGYWSTFDRWTTPGTPSVFSGSKAIASWGSAPDLTTGNNKHWGNPGNALFVPLPLEWNTSPVQWRDGAPVPPLLPTPPSAERPIEAQLDLSNPDTPTSLTDQLMNGVVFYYQTRYDISPLDVATLQDSGIRLERLFRNGFE